MTIPALQLPRARLVFDRPRVMGVLNVTPDSFSDGGAWRDPARAVDHALAMVAAGADLIDVGGESTRPGATGVPIEEELDRVLPVIEALATTCPVPVSVDTSAPQVMRAAAGAGAQLVNDVRALQRPGALEAVAELGLAACLIGLYLSYFHDLPYGPTLILSLGAFFAAALVVRVALPQT